MKQKRNYFALILAVFCCVAVMYVCTVIGVANIPFGDANRILLHELFHMDVDISDISRGSISIICNVRLPRILMGFITGAALAICGAGYQGIFRNPMADPYVLGVSSGASLGASIGIVLNFSTGILGLNGTTLLAFAGSLGTIVLVYSISRIGKRVPVSTLLLSGIAVNLTLSALQSLIMLLNQQSMDVIMRWSMGSLNGKGWNQVVTVLPYVIVGICILLSSSRDLDIMLTGEDTAMQLGVNVEYQKKKILFASSILTAAVISVTGVIGFVGLVVPHVVRIFAGPKHKTLMIYSILFGGMFLVICDTVARSLITQEIPVGIITSLCGGPFFLYLLRKSKRGGTFS